MPVIPKSEQETLVHSSFAHPGIRVSIMLGGVIETMGCRNLLSPHCSSSVASLTDQMSLATVGRMRFRVDKIK